MNYETNCHEPDIPLSFPQARLLKLNEMEISTASHNIPIIVVLSGFINTKCLEEALNDVVSRHGVLRTLFVKKKDVVRQTVLKSFSALRLQRHTVESSKFMEALNSAINYKFELSKEIPFKAWLFDIPPVAFSPPGSYYLLLLVHNFAMDARSFDSLAADLSQAYESRCNGQPPEWPDEPKEYSEYVLTQQQLLGNKNDRDSLLSRNIAFWKEDIDRLSDFSFLGDRPVRRIASREDYVILPFRLNSAVHSRLLKFAGSKTASLMEIFHTALLMAISIHKSCTKIPIGIVTSGRTENFKSSVGVFENILMLCIDVSGVQNFHDVLKLAQKKYRFISGHMDIPFEFLESAVDPSTIGYLRQAVISIKPVRENSLRLPGVTCSVNQIITPIGRFNLVFDLIERHTEDGIPAGVEGIISFRKDVFEQNEVVEIINRIFLILKSVGECSVKETLSRKVTLKNLQSSAVNYSGWRQLYVPARDALQVRLIQVWEELFISSRIGARDKFVDLENDETLYKRMISAVEKIYGTKLKISSDYTQTSIESLSNDMVNQLPLAPSIMIQAGNPQKHPPFFFLHGDVLGGGWYAFELSRILGKEYPFYALPPHGINGRGIPMTVESMAEKHVADLCQIHPDGPYCVGGYCNGAVIAIEMAHILKRRGYEVACLILIDTPGIDLRTAAYINTNIADKDSSYLAPPANLNDFGKKTWVLFNVVKICLQYKTQYYDGNIHVIKGKDSLIGSNDAAFKKIGKDIDFRLIRGDHKNCISKYIGDLGIELKDILP